MKKLLPLIMILIVLPFRVTGATYQLPETNVGQEKSAAINTNGSLKYAVNTPIKNVFHKQGKSGNGQWTQMFDGSWEYRIRFESKNATSLNIGMSDFFLPHSAELWVSTDDQQILRGPYNDSYNKNHGFFWVGDVPGDHINLKITVSDREKPFLSFSIDNVTRGFYKYWEEPSYLNKSGNCNVDVACPEADGWDTPINSVGRYAFVDPFTGGEFCTGQLINNTAEDGKPYFLTADHCGFSFDNGTSYTTAQKQSTAASFALVWNYQSLTCRAPGSSLSGTPISTSGFDQRQAGATYVASNSLSDFALVELNEIPDSVYQLEYTGWDRSDVAPDGAVSIHHPSGHAKRFSLEADATSITFYSADTASDEGDHILVPDWDVGTTENGSSGSGLWNMDQLLVGQLHGGFAQCGNDLPDWYGRLFTSWDAGDTAETRLKEWLDPEDTGQLTLTGFGGCEAPEVSLVNNSTNQVGEQIQITAQVSGGAGGYTYAWDLNDDQTVESVDTSFQARFNQSYAGIISLIVRDSTGCGTKVSQALVITGADIQLQDVVNIRENLDQVCGNNDNVIDPGERWTTLLQAQNVGDTTGSAAYLAMAKRRQSSIVGTSDDFGNTVTSCNRSFIDISNTGNLLTWEAANEDFPPDDDGSVLIELSEGFNHYGETISTLRASSNGYFSTSLTSDGGDWSNDCPIPATPDLDVGGARIAPLHDDLLASAFYHQSFSVCPRPAESGNDLACEVFLWKGADLFNTPAITENFDVQAILYPATSQWVFQYAGTDFDGDGATAAIQNSDASDGLVFACNNVVGLNTSEAACFFNKNHQPLISGSQFVMLESPVVSLGDMSPNETQSRSVNFAIAEDAQCGTEIGLDFQAAVYDEGFNAGQESVLISQIGNNGQCQTVTHCNVGTSTSFASNDIVIKPGLWWNENRNGNGFDWYTLDQSNLVYLFYTGDTAGEPIWYLASDADSKHNQYFNNITQYQVTGGFGQGDLTFDTVGWSNTSFIDNSHAIQVREIDGQLSAEKLYFFQYGADQTPNLHTGLYYTPSEAGWGQSVGTLGNARVVINYLYTDVGEPYWTIASGDNNDSVFDVYYFNTFCPSCPAITKPGQIVGDIRMSLNGQTNGTLHQYNVTGDGVNWSRSNLPVVNLIPPQN